MSLNSRFHDIFKSKVPVIGMIHLAGRDPLSRALEELAIYEEEGVEGAIIENYHGSHSDMEDVLKVTQGTYTKVVLGINVLPNEYFISFPMADMYGAEFIQLDHVAGSYTGGRLEYSSYCNFKESFPDIVVLGGVWPK